MMRRCSESLEYATPVGYDARSAMWYETRLSTLYGPYCAPPWYCASTSYAGGEGRSLFESNDASVCMPERWIGIGEVNSVVDSLVGVASSLPSTEDPNRVESEEEKPEEDGVCGIGRGMVYCLALEVKSWAFDENWEVKSLTLKLESPFAFAANFSAKPAFLLSDDEKGLGNRSVCSEQG